MYIYLTYMHAHTTHTYVPHIQIQCMSHILFSILKYLNKLGFFFDKCFKQNFLSFKRMYNANLTRKGVLLRF